jgi:hypothetical protein
MVYALWDRQSGNCIGEFETEGEALAVVEGIAEDNGMGALTELELLSVDAQGNLHPIAGGAQLLDRAAGPAHDRNRRSA